MLSDLRIAVCWFDYVLAYMHFMAQNETLGILGSLYNSLQQILMLQTHKLTIGRVTCLSLPQCPLEAWNSTM